jgi:hypothetical protein
LSHPLITQARAGSPGGLRVPAPEIEQLVAKRFCQFLSEPDSILEATEQLGLDSVSRHRLIDRAVQIASGWSTLPSAQMRALFTMLIRQIAVVPERVDLQILPARLPTVLGTAPAILGSADQQDANVLTLSIAAQLRRTGKEMRMRIERSDTFPARPNPSLIKLIVRAHLFQARLLQHAGGKFAELARRERLNRSYYSRVIRLTYLAPDITRAILDGRQPANLTAAMLLEHPSLPFAWPEQRKALGFT